MSEALTADVDGVAVRTGHLIGNEWVGSSATFESRSPLDWDNLHLADVARGDATTAAAAVSAAVAGFEAWGQTTVHERAEVMHRLADLIVPEDPDNPGQPVLLDDLSASAVYQMILSFGARSAARSRWISIGGADLNPGSSVPDVLQFLFEGTDPDGTVTTVFPMATRGATQATKPRRGRSSGHTAPMTPMASCMASVTLRNGVA